jgi:hypothetical protein
MVILIEATQWIDNRDSKKRVHLRDTWDTGMREFVINPNRISDLKVHYDANGIADGSQFLFSDNHRDRRESNSFIICNQTVAEIEAAHNTPYFSKFTTLPFFHKNNPNRVPVDTTLDVEDIAYFDRYNPDPLNYVWLVYNRKAFKRVEQLVNYNLEQVPDVLLTGTTSTTTTTPADTTTSPTETEQC